MTLRGAVRWGITVIFGISLIPIINLNVERLAEREGWDQILSSRWDAGITAMASFAENPWFLVFFGTILGGTLFMWGDHAVRRLIGRITIVRPNIPTSILVQFQAGSENVVQLANENVASSHFDRQVFSFFNDKGELFRQDILWTAILIFNKPTHYGQIIVDAGNAAIPEYQIVSQKINFAIIRFSGDLGNVVIEIRCIPANRRG